MQFGLHESILNYFTAFVTSAAKQIYNQIFEKGQGTYVVTPHYVKAYYKPCFHVKTDQ